jgi:hypothetical protein
MLNLLLFTLIVFTLIVTYLFWIRPVLKTKPSFAAYYAQEDSVWGAFSAKFGGLKQKLTTAFVMMAGFVVTSYDIIAPLAAQSGVDVTKLTTRVPPQAWPIIGMVLIGLLQYFRYLGDKRTTEVLVAKGIDPASVLNPPLK